MPVAKLVTIGGERACILAEEAPKHLPVNGDDTLLLTGTAEGFILRRYSELAEEGMREYRDALRELAK
jgi:hypothetical protein